MWGWKNKGTFEADGDVAERDSSRMEPALDEASKAAAQQVISDRMSRSGAYSASDFVSIPTSVRGFLHRAVVIRDMKRCLGLR
jgi:hypothetical protein